VMVRFGSALPGARPRDVEWPDVGEERLPGERPAVPGGESLIGVCAGRRNRRSQCRAGAAQRRSTSHQRPCGVRSSPTSLNAGFAGKLTPRRRDDCGVPQQAGRRLARQVTRSAGRERPLGRREKPPSRLERGSLTPRLLSLGVGRRRQTAPPQYEAASRRSTASAWKPGSCAADAIEPAGWPALVGRWQVSLDKGDNSLPAFCPLLCPPLPR
jgi:hypothetical protein